MKKPNSQILLAEEAALGMLKSFEGTNTLIRKQYGYDGAMQPYEDVEGVLMIDISLVNEAAATRIVHLSPGIDGPGTLAGLVTAGAFNDKGGNAGLTGSTTAPLTLTQFFKMAQRNPMKLLGISANSTSDTQRSQKLTVRTQSPFRDLESEPIPFGKKLDDKSSNLKTLRLDLRSRNIQIDDQTLIELPVVASSTLDLTLYIGGIFNSAGLLAQQRA